MMFLMWLGSRCLGFHETPIFLSYELLGAGLLIRRSDATGISDKNHGDKRLTLQLDIAIQQKQQSPHKRVFLYPFAFSPASSAAAHSEGDLTVDLVWSCPVFIA